ncbi:hypothetical protein HHK36_015540 [Tetracentron sinense]|uniref:U3 small nucleolar ribonucleoprotein protein IMP3 n=1 Tax=Tetracentron sinense TaxID=13715 RepID=A0A834Z142_TETSI|nr:hypothetical protein HHK36_015540 [Tetracentron sinense]
MYVVLERLRGIYAGIRGIAAGISEKNGLEMREGKLIRFTRILGFLFVFVSRFLSLYSGLCRMVQKLVNILKQMDPRDPFRIEMTDMVLEKLYNIGVIPTRKSLALCERLSVSSFCRYSGLCRMVQKLVNILKQMDPRDPFRIEMTDMVLEKLYNIGVIPTRKSLALCERLSVSSFCRRRLSAVLVRLKFAEHLREAITYIEQGHIRVGTDTITDPAFLVTRNLEDFVTWVDSSKIKRKVLEYNERLDDYDAMN